MHRAGRSRPRRRIRRASCSPVGPRASTRIDAPLPDKRLVRIRAAACSASATACRPWATCMGGHVVPAERREYGKAHLRLLGRDGLLARRGARSGRPGDGVDEPRRHGAEAAARASPAWPPPTIARSQRWRILPGGSTPCSSTRRWPTPRRARGCSRTSSAPRGQSATGPCRSSWTRRSRASAGRWAGTACCARSRAGWTPPWWPR